MCVCVGGGVCVGLSGCIMYVCMYVCSVASVSQLVGECFWRIETSGTVGSKV